METHNTAVFFIVHFLHLQAVRLKDTKDSDFISDFLVMAVRRTKTKKAQGAVRSPNIQTSHRGTCGW